MERKETLTISDYYRGKTILVTGPTGFIGKVLIWKLLQSCSDIDHIFILLRPKYNMDVRHRVAELLQTPVSTRSFIGFNFIEQFLRMTHDWFQIFDNFRKNNPHVLKKVKAIAGDIAEPKLGLTPGDEQQLVDSVHILSLIHI